MGFSFSFNIYGVPQLMAKADKLTIGLKDFRPAWETISKDFYKMEEGRFASGGAWGESARWDPLSPKYAAWKEREAPGKPIMVLSGELRESLTHEGGNNIKAVAPEYVMLGTKNPLGAWHFWATGNRPQRRAIDLKPGDRTRWMRHIAKYVDDMMKSPWSGAVA